MKVNLITKEILADRRSFKQWSGSMNLDEWTRIEADYRLQRGGYDAKQYKITDVRISHDGKHLWFKTNIPKGQPK